MQNKEKQSGRKSWLPKWVKTLFTWLWRFLVAIGFLSIIANFVWGNFVYKYLRDIFVPPIVVSQEEIIFEKTAGNSEKEFRLINRSQETHFNIELQVFVEGLDEAFEQIEVKLLEKSDKSQMIKMSEIQSLEDISSILPEDAVLEYAFLRLTDAGKDKRKFVYAMIGELKPQEVKRFAVAFRSIRDDSPEGLNILRVSPRILTFDQAEFPTVIDLRPYEFRFEIKCTEKVDVIPMKTPMMSPVLFRYQGNEVYAILDVRKKTWFCADQVCRILKIKDVTQALEGLQRHEKLTASLSYRSDGKNSFKKVLIPEKKLEHIAKRSTKVIASPFLAWVSKVVLPQLENKGVGKPKKSEELREGAVSRAALTIEPVKHPNTTSYLLVEEVSRERRLFQVKLRYMITNTGQQPATQLVLQVYKGRGTHEADFLLPPLDKPIERETYRNFMNELEPANIHQLTFDIPPGNTKFVNIPYNIAVARPVLSDNRAATIRESLKKFGVPHMVTLYYMSKTRPSRQYKTQAAYIINEDSIRLIDVSED